MKRLDLVQLTIIIVGIMSAFFSLEVIPTFFVYLLSWFSDGLSGSYSMQYFIYTILLLAAYLIFTIYTIKYSKQLAEYLCSKGNMDANVNLALDKKDLLYVLFVGMGVYGLIKNVPIFIKDIYEIATRDKDINPYEGMSLRLPGSNIYTEGVMVGAYYVLMHYADVFADFLANRIKNTEPEDEITNPPEP